MEHKGTITIETSRLILRKFTESDIEPAFNNWTSDDKVTKYLTWPTHKDISVTRRVIEQWIKENERADFYQWAVELKKLGQPIGTISVVEKDEQVNMAQIGYCIGSKWWHQGIVSEAFSAILPFLFEEVGANRIEAIHDPENPNSGLVMKKCGLKYEGTLRQSHRNNRGIVDACIYSLLKSEWSQLRE